MPLSSGTSLGRYKILSQLGVGGMGEVYLALDSHLNRNVALKVLPADLVNNRERLHRFKQEAQAASALNHQNIITIYEIGSEGDTHFIAAEFVDGETLRRKFQTARLEIEETLTIAIQIATALDAAHRRGIVHRDIKPENVMLREDGLVKVLDFGLAKLTEKKTDAPADTQAPTQVLIKTSIGAVMGTAAYMSPEQARGLEVDARTDIFSLGVCLYEMFAGRLPFTGETTSDVIAAILKTEPAPLSKVNQEIPVELERIIGKALAKDREERYQTAKDLLIDLQQLKKQIGIKSEIERSEQPDKTESEKATQIMAARPTSSTARVAGEIRKHKLGFTIALGVLLFTAIGLGYWFLSNRGASTKQIELIAVLPFINESGNADVEYLSDGMTESLINSLSQLPNLSVKARSTVFRYKGKEIEPQTVAAELSVQAILSGRVVQRGDDLVLYLSLVDGRNGNQLWGEQYNRKLTDLVALQSDIARDVANKLRAKLSGADESRVTKRYTDNTEAYELYLKGRFFAGGKITEEGIKRSIEYYQQAIEKDPNYALAFVGLAQSYIRLGHVWGFLPPRETFPKAKAAITKALEIDETLADAHTALADYYLSYEWNWLEAEREVKLAIELNANDSAAHWIYGSYLQIMGRFDEAITERKLTRELDPLSPTTTANIGYPYYYARQYNQAIEYYRKALELDPNYAWSYLWIGQAYVEKGMYEEAITEINKAITLSESSTRMTATLGYAYAVAGKRDEAQKVIVELQEQSKRRYVPPYFIAVVYSGLGEKEQAFEWLEKAYQERHPYLTLLKVEPVFDKLRSDPRFADLIRRVGLPQ
ncbi:MAG: protein kinase [Acidobacteria bacterium]|nr:protein kinase [Acidobacteriota bacterium]